MWLADFLRDPKGAGVLSQQAIEATVRKSRTRPQEWISGLLLLTAVVGATAGRGPAVAIAAQDDPTVPRVTVRTRPTEAAPRRSRVRGTRAQVRRRVAPSQATLATRDSTTVSPRESAAGLNARAYRLQRQGRHREAEPLLRRALELKPDYAYGLYNLGWSLLEQDRPAEAIPYLKKTAAMQPGRWEPQERLAEAYSRLGQRTQAEQARSQARRLREERGQTAVPAANPVATATTPPSGSTAQTVRVAVGEVAWRQSTDRREEQWLRDRRDRDAGVGDAGKDVARGERDR